MFLWSAEDVFKLPLYSSSPPDSKCAAMKPLLLVLSDCLQVLFTLTVLSIVYFSLCIYFYAQIAQLLGGEETTDLVPMKDFLR